MKRFLAFVCMTLPAIAADPWPLEKLFTRPYMWGTTPDQITWSKKNHTLAFLWNAQGNRFRDLYAYDPESRKLTRLTDLANLKDPLNTPAGEKDERLKRYLLPPDGLTSFDLSRDGARAAFSYRGDIWIVRTNGAEAPFRLTRTRSAETAPEFSPDRQKIAFLRDGQLYTQDLNNGQLSQISEIEDGQVAAYRWSPDGRRVLFVTRSNTAGRRLLLPNYSGRVVTATAFPRTLPGDQPGEGKTYVAPAEGGEAKLMEPGPWGARVYSFELPEWSPDGHWILQRVIHPGMKKSQLLVLDPDTRNAAVLTEDSDPAWVEPGFSTWSPDSRDVLFTSERDGFAHLYKIPRAGGTPVQLTHGKFEIHTERLFARDPQWIGDWIYFSSTEPSPAERQFYRIRPDRSAKERLSKGPGIHVGVVSEDGRYTATMDADPHHPFDVYVNGARVTTSPHKEFATYPWPESRFVEYPSRDGKMVSAKMMLPPGYNPDDRTQKPRPAVFFIHGSGYATSVLKQWGSYVDIRYVFNTYLANKGYVVFEMDYRGSSGYGRDWRTGVYLHMGGKDLDDVLSGIDYLKSLGNIDVKRLGIWGSSYGGFMTDMAMFLAPDAFKAGAAFSAVNDWENYNAYYTEQRLTKPDQNPEAYRRSSPITYTQGLKNPLLIVHGIVDNNVMFQDAVQLAEKLIHESKSFEQAYYPEESHAFARDETLIDVFRRAAEFFDRNL